MFNHRFQKNNRFTNTRDTLTLVEDYGLNKNNTKNIHPPFISQAKDFGTDFQQCKTKSTQMGWFRKPYGALAGNLAYRLYIDLCPSNAVFLRPVRPSELIAIIQMMETCHKDLMLGEVDGLEINRLCGLFEAIKSGRLIDLKCSKCQSEFIVEGEDITTICPVCIVKLNPDDATGKLTRKRKGMPRYQGL